MSDFLWVEKYRPKKISDCILTEDLKNTFSKFLKQKEIPNLPFQAQQVRVRQRLNRGACAKN